MRILWIICNITNNESRIGVEEELGERDLLLQDLVEIEDKADALKEENKEKKNKKKVTIENGSKLLKQKALSSLIDNTPSTKTAAETAGTSRIADDIEEIGDSASVATTTKSGKSTKSKNELLEEFITNKKESSMIEAAKVELRTQEIKLEEMKLEFQKHQLESDRRERQEMLEMMKEERKETKQLISMLLEQIAHRNNN